MVPIKTFAIGCIITTLTGLVSGTFYSTIAQKPSLQTQQTCKTWQEVKSQIQMIYMGSIGATTIPDMP